MKNATLRQLRIFVEIAKQGSFTRAAQSLHLTPPAITIQIKELEAHVGLPLFDRSKKQISLSTAGEYTLVYARKILATLQDAEDMATRLRRVQGGELRIGMVGTAQYFLPKLLAEFRRDHEGLDIRLAVGNREQLVKMLQENEVDLAVMGRPPKEMATRAEPFAANPLVFIAPPGHALSKVEQPQLLALAGFHFVIREPGSGTRAAMEAFFKQAQFEPQIMMETSSNEAIKQAVMAGMGLSFISLHTIKLELDNRLLVILPVEATPTLRAWNIVHTASKILSPAAEAFRYFILEHAESHLAQQFGPYLPQLAA